MAEAVIDRAEQLPDLLAPRLKLIFVGPQAGGCSAKAGGYFAGRGNRFWPVLHEIGLTPRQLAPVEYREMLPLGFGFTDLVKVAGEKERAVKPGPADIAAFEEKLKRFSPAAVAFTAKGAAVSYLGKKPAEIGYGRQPSQGDDAPVFFVLPSPSGAARKSWDLAPWQEMAEWIKRAS
jgi:TDG/mug DNA glycosylase family protein